MSIFHAHDSKLIERVEVRPITSSIKEATIIARPGVDGEALENVRRELGKKDYSTLMDSVNGSPAIQVRGFTDEMVLIETLNDIQALNGQTHKEVTAEDREKGKFSEIVRDNALFLSALFYDIGNAAFFVSGIQRGRHNKGGHFTANDKSEILIGATFSIGDILMTCYGHDRGDEELSAANEGLKKYLQEQGIKVPDGDTLNPDSLHNSGVMKAMDHWLRHHVVQVKTLTEMAGGLFTMHSAMKPGNRNNGKLLAGALLSSGWAATFLLDSNPGDRIFDKQDSPPEGVIGHMKDNPRGWIARPLSMANNVANLWGSLNSKTGERARFAREVTDAQEMVRQNSSAENLAHLAYTQTKRHDYIWNVISAGSFLVAHSLFGLSGSKRPTESDDDKRIMDDLVLLSANVVAQQPEEVREKVIGDTAEYVSHLAHVSLNKDQLATAIRGKIDSLTQSSWADRVQIASQSQSRDSGMQASV